MLDEKAKGTEIAFRRRVGLVKNVGRKGEVGVERVDGRLGEERGEIETSRGGEVEKGRGWASGVDRIGEENASGR